MSGIIDYNDSFTFHQKSNKYQGWARHSILTAHSFLIYLAICISLLLFTSCKNISKPDYPVLQTDKVGIANQFIDAFYSFNRDSLASVLLNAVESQPEILYYQKWAECGNYKVLDRPDCIIKNDSLVLCPVTVKDDLMGALMIDFNVTDTFHLTIIGGRIRSVTTSSNDPEMYDEAKEWVKKNHPEIIEIPCQGIWEGGPTPCECVRAMVRGFTEFILQRGNNKKQIL